MSASDLLGSLRLALTARLGGRRSGMPCPSRSEARGARRRRAFWLGECRLTVAGQRRPCTGLPPTRRSVELRAQYRSTPAGRTIMGDVRIVSLLPSATEIVSLLG